ncbi:NCK-interacting protein with SH3 domain [Neocloeon triangulifer]|uniref:NCK-interacting protein with SH3 domain n=1 Tax=Neocloeon triangulifer TaxID=2078957 RepID=UPI00286EB6F5|nr:NCK-interacting protein with SH3 domain [Neocloeon triangulifer]
MSDNNDLELLRALYDFNATDPKTISFKQNDLFVNLEKNIGSRKWWKVVNKDGLVGFIPCNYVSSQEESVEDVLNFIDVCSIALKSSSSGGSSAKLLTDLEAKRKRITGSCGSFESSTPRAPPEGAPSQPNNETKSSSAPPKDMNEEQNMEAAYELVQQVRQKTGLNHDLSCVAVKVVLEGMRELPFDIVSAPVISVTASLLGLLSAGREMPDSVLDNTHDAFRLKVVLEELATAKDDDQQRSWMLHEDEQTLKDYLSELQSILRDADSKVCIRVLERMQWEGVEVLLQFYQMECRWSIRECLLKALSGMCALHTTPRVIMLSSVLPMELARDMLSNPNDLARLVDSGNLLTMIFSTGQPMPVTHLEHLGAPFVEFLLSNLEQPPESDVMEQIPDVFLRLIVAINLQFKESSENVLLKVLSKCTVAQSFTEKVLLLFNREDDPVAQFCSSSAKIHSIVKLFLDLFSNSTTAQLFYTNDTKVLLDIISRQLADLSPCDERRGQYLELCRRVVRHSNYEEHNHRKSDILKCLQHILTEENEESRSDQALVNEIISEFPEIFG